MIIVREDLPAADFIRVDPDGKFAREVHVLISYPTSNGGLLQRWLPSGYTVDPDAPVALSLVRVLGEPMVLETLFEGFAESHLEVLEFVRVTAGAFL